MDKPADRDRARRWGAVTLVLLLAALSWAIYTDTAGSGGGESSLERGVRQLAFGIETGEQSHFIAARKHLSDATSGVYVERYPAFVLQSVERLQPRVLDGARTDGPRPAAEPFYDAVADGEWTRARRWVEEHSERAPISDQSEYMLRLVDSLERLADEDVVE